MTDFTKTLIAAAMHGNSLIGFNCKVKRSYKSCKDGMICRPVEGSFVTECEVPGCKKFM